MISYANRSKDLVLSRSCCGAVGACLPTIPSSKLALSKFKDFKFALRYSAD